MNQSARNVLRREGRTFHAQATIRGAVGLSAALTSLAALAGPPFLTDDPEAVALHHYEFYVATVRSLTAEGRSGTAPHLEFNYGALPNLQLHVITPLAFNSPGGSTTHRGYGDTEVGAKYQFNEETSDMPMVGVFPIYLFPTGDASLGLGNGASQLFLPLWLQKSWGAWTSYGGGGYLINRAAGAKNSRFYGGQLQRKLSAQWTLGAELFHRTEQVAGQGASTGFNLGGSYNVDEHNHVLYSVGKGLQNASRTNRVSSYIAYQMTY